MVGTEQSVGILLVALVITFLIAKMFFSFVAFVYRNMPTPESAEQKYWDDAGDGSGVNYVQMPDGGVRID